LCDSTSQHKTTACRISARLHKLRFRAATLLVAAALFTLVIVLGGFLSNLWLGVLTLALIAGIGATGLNLVMGHTGLVSIGNAGFMGLSALTVAESALYLKLPFPLGLLAGSVTAAVFGLAVGLPSLRIKGLYLAMATLAFHFIAVWVIQIVQRMQVGNGVYLLPEPQMGSISIASPVAWFVFVAVVLTAIVLLTDTLLSRKPGRCWNMIREDQAVAAASGIPVSQYKLAAFVISSAIVGLGGGIYAYYVGVVSSEDFTLTMALGYIAMVIIGGLGSRWGAVVGAVFVVTLPNVVAALSELAGLSNANSGSVFLIEGALVGIAIVAIIVFEPRGLAGLLRRLARTLDTTARWKVLSVRATTRT
jgi:branched-chain amino acid transport system permease protein